MKHTPEELLGLWKVAPDKQLGHFAPDEEEVNFYNAAHAALPELIEAWEREQKVRDIIESEGCGWCEDSPAQQCTICKITKALDRDEPDLEGGENG